MDHLNKCALPAPSGGRALSHDVKPTNPPVAIRLDFIGFNEARGPVPHPAGWHIPAPSAWVGNGAPDPALRK
jgi:hypothetical protein